jgi:VWFA-related protein
MKKVYLLLWMMLFLLSTSLQAASNELLFEGEGQIEPTLLSLELLDVNLLDQTGEDISVNVVSYEWDFPDIVLNATVLDSNGKPIEGLTAADFGITEQSGNETGTVSQTLTCFEENASAAPISLALVFDVSGSMSMEDRLNDAKIAAVNFLGTAQAGDRASLVSFSGCDQGGIIMPSVDVRQDSDQDHTPDINEAIKGLTPITRTAVYDGIADGIDSISEEAFPKGVIVFTDGNTNSDCHYSINQVIQKAKDKGIPVYTIGLQSDAMAEELNTIATETGGYYTEAPTALDMEALYTDIAQSIRGRYTLCYTTKNPAKDGTLRTVTVNAEGKTGTGTYTAPLSPPPPPQPPVANAGPDASVNEGNLTTLDGSASSASTSDKQLTFAWRQLSGTNVTLSNPTIAKPTFTAPLTGPEGANLVFELKVTDSANKTGTDTVAIAVNDSLAPKADFTWSPASPEAEQPITFTDTSLPEGGPIVSWDWDFGGQGVSNFKNPSFTFPESGTYDVKLTVRDASGSVGVSAPQAITVREKTCPGGDCGGSGGCFIRSAGAAFMME